MIQNVVQAREIIKEHAGLINIQKSHIKFLDDRIRKLDAKIIKQAAKIAELENTVNKMFKRITERAWISVKDRLPEESGNYIVYCEIADGTIVITLNYSHGWFIKKPDKVTHWMPLPQPPEE